MATIFCNARFDDATTARLREGARGHRLVESRDAIASNLAAAATDEAVRDAEIRSGQPSLETPRLGERLAWVHLTSAGYARYAEPDAQAILAERGIALTTSSTVYAVPCAEQALAAMLLFARRLDVCLAEQAEARWSSETHRRASTLLTGSRVLLLGFGAIGRALAERLVPFAPEIVALRRTPRDDDPVTTIDRDALPHHLARADHVVNLLPGGSATHHLLDAARLAEMRPGAFLYNVGRGTTVDQEALLPLLMSGRLGGAYLDVTDPEPLPADHPLWRAPRCIITPHVAGGRGGEHRALVEHFLANLDRYARGEPLRDRVA